MASKSSSDVGQKCLGCDFACTGRVANYCCYWCRDKKKNTHGIHCKKMALKTFPHEDEERREEAMSLSSSEGKGQKCVSCDFLCKAITPNHCCTTFKQSKGRHATCCRKMMWGKNTQRDERSPSCVRQKGPSEGLKSYYFFSSSSSDSDAESRHYIVEEGKKEGGSIENGVRTREHDISRCKTSRSDIASPRPRGSNSRSPQITTTDRPCGSNSRSPLGRRCTSSRSHSRGDRHSAPRRRTSTRSPHDGSRYTAPRSDAASSSRTLIQRRRRSDSRSSRRRQYSAPHSRGNRNRARRRQSCSRSPERSKPIKAKEKKEEQKAVGTSLSPAASSKWQPMPRSRSVPIGVTEKKVDEKAMCSARGPETSSRRRMTIMSYAPIPQRRTSILGRPSYAKTHDEDNKLAFEEEIGRCAVSVSGFRQDINFPIEIESSTSEKVSEAEMIDSSDEVISLPEIVISDDESSPANEGRRQFVPDQEMFPLFLMEYLKDEDATNHGTQQNLLVKHWTDALGDKYIAEDGTIGDETKMEKCVRRLRLLGIALSKNTMNSYTFIDLSKAIATSIGECKKKALERSDENLSPGYATIGHSDAIKEAIKQLRRIHTEDNPYVREWIFALLEEATRVKEEDSPSCTTTIIRKIVALQEMDRCRCFDPRLVQIIMQSWNQSRAWARMNAKPSIWKKAVTDLAKKCASSSEDTPARTTIDWGYAPPLTRIEKDAVIACMRKRITVLSASPGANITTVALVIISAWLLQGFKVLAVAPSDRSCANLCQAFNAFASPERIMPLSVHVNPLASEWYRREMFTAQRLFVNAALNGEEGSDGKNAVSNFKQALEQRGTNLSSYMNTAAKNVNVVMCTYVDSADERMFGGIHFHRVLMLEADQIQEPMALLPLWWGATGLCMVGRAQDVEVKEEHIGEEPAYVESLPRYPIGSRRRGKGGRAASAAATVGEERHQPKAETEKGADLKTSLFRRLIKHCFVSEEGGTLFKLEQGTVDLSSSDEGVEILS